MLNANVLDMEEGYKFPNHDEWMGSYDLDWEEQLADALQSLTGIHTDFDAEFEPGDEWLQVPVTMWEGDATEGEAWKCILLYTDEGFKCLLWEYEEEYTLGFCDYNPQYPPPPVTVEALRGVMEDVKNVLEQAFAAYPATQTPPCG